MKRFFDFSKGNIIRFLLLTAIVSFFYLEGLISLTLFMFFEIIFLIRFIHVKKYVEMKLLNHYPAYEHLPGWAKWIIILLAYLVIFIILKWILINVIIEGVLNIPINNEIQELANYSTNS
ncbi:hypothetical protein GF412_05340 [Candidatus Micrarchaeota archaeon]|nr:hypothetical protein [Candidatus Micrarchaeota archaeon]MBD3418376.1 hypothetical protein [Candidatus Micrarchaeota archaeon]